ncbi:thioredoxin-dependent thiol peroxidase [Kosmotoga olearia]|uniref:thioredoxin-dependent peroxiredoxin n=1 Tax=Kosmotoga olearia (strain ATCC BAA-1733 / DSM 21960 / TBF 19.5.1) TaxID=521045 RepID=C5CJ30_KOSOT|nr:thioredoxin-dependent thiol peroxidase [Kosmotoga olearia]ACR79946.1 alkyl hydroperoxide reductase/ Thiol specific antioxidant/ Mal allergen [Kosmotoga olearia TBF 19.5.1]
MESKAIVGKPVPDFTLENENGESVTLSSFRGKCVVLYFYPKDNTPGCTLEAQDFRDHLKDFEALNTIVLGVSKDSVKSHMNFAKKLNLNFHLLSDPEAKVHKIFDVLKPKKRFGKEYIGTERSTFVIDKDGILIKEYRKVKVKGHVQEVLEFIKSNCG